MPSLPYELLVMICSYLAIPQLKIARLASPTLSEICEKFLYRHMVLKPNVESFRRLDLVSNHPRYRHYVESLDCCGYPLYYNISERSRPPLPLHHKSKYDEEGQRFCWKPSENAGRGALSGSLHVGTRIEIISRCHDWASQVLPSHTYSISV